MGKLKIVIGNIVSEDILIGHDLIINPTNPQMVCGGGVSGAIFYKAGANELEEYTQKKFDIHYFSSNYKKENIMKIGDIRITPGFNLKMDILFIQGPKEYEHDDALELLLSTYRNLLNYLSNSKYKNILLPSLGTGTYGFTHEEVGHIVYSLLNEFVKKEDINITLVLSDEFSKKYYK